MLTASIRDAALSIAIRFRNLSPNGALVESEAMPREGSGIILQHNGQLLRGRVVWTDGHRGGVRFEQPQDLNASLRHVSKPKQTWSPRPRRPGLKCKPLSDNERRMLEKWVALGVTAPGD